MISAQKSAGSVGFSNQFAFAAIVGLLFCRRCPDGPPPVLMSWSSVVPESTEYPVRAYLSVGAVVLSGRRAYRFPKGLIQVALNRPAAGS